MVICLISHLTGSSYDQQVIQILSLYLFFIYFSFFVTIYVITETKFDYTEQYCMFRDKFDCSLKNINKSFIEIISKRINNYMTVVAFLNGGDP